MQYSYSGANCSECPFQAECAGKGGKKKITSDYYEAERRRMAAKMQSEAGKVEYKKRKATVEWPFGNIKHNIKFREFLIRGIENVRNEFNLVCTAHNRKVMWAKLCRKGSPLSEIVGLVQGQAAKVAAL